MPTSYFVKPYTLTAGLISLLSLGSPAFASPSLAAVLNGGFENGLTNWITSGDVSTQTASFGSGPTEENFQALLTTASSIFEDDFPLAAGVFNFSGNDPTTVGVAGGLETFLSLPLGSLDPNANNFEFATEGSAIKQTFTAQAGDVLTFNWNFLTNDANGMGDYAFIVLNGLSSLANANATLSPSLTPFSKETGYKSFSRTFTTAGTYTLALGVVDVGDVNSTSALLVDNIKLTSSSQKIPEPISVLSLLAFGALGAGSALKRKHQQKGLDNSFN